MTPLSRREVHHLMSVLEESYRAGRIGDIKHEDEDVCHPVDLDEVRIHLLDLAERARDTQRDPLANLLLIVVGMIDASGNVVTPPEPYEPWAKTESVEGAYGVGLSLLLRNQGKL